MDGCLWNMPMGKYFFFNKNNSYKLKVKAYQTHGALPHHWKPTEGDACGGVPVCATPSCSPDWEIDAGCHIHLPLFLPDAKRS